MKQYPSYKPSLTNCLDNIPSNWALTKIKFLLQQKRGAIKTGPFGSQLKSSDLVENGDIKIYNQRSVIDKNFIGGEEYISLDKFETLKEFVVCANDLLITTRGTIGKCVIFPDNAEKGVLHPCLIRLQLDQKKILNEYAALCFEHAMFFQEEIKLLSNSTVIEVIYSNNLKEVFIPLCSVEEQIQIVKYLKYKTALIDRFILNRQKQIALLKEQLYFKINEAITKGINKKVKLKRTDIKYVPEIPAHWDIRKFKSLTTILTCGYASTPDYVEESEGILFLSAQNVKPFRMVFDKLAYIGPELHKKLTKRKRPLKGDVLVTRIGGESNIGDACVIDIDLEFSIYVSLTHIRPGSEILSEYIVYFFNTEYCYQLNHEGTVVGGGQGNLNVKNVERYRIPLPPIEEQKEIISYLDNYRTEMDTLISKYQKQIDLMQEYRSAIISQAVTGKIDVRDWQPKAKEIIS